MSIACWVSPRVFDDNGSEVAEAREISALSPVAPDTNTAEPFGIVVPVVFLTRNRTTCALMAAVAPVIAAWSIATVIAVVPLADTGDVPTTDVTYVPAGWYVPLWSWVLLE